MQTQALAIKAAEEQAGQAESVAGVSKDIHPYSHSPAAPTTNTSRRVGRKEF